MTGADGSVWNLSAPVSGQAAGVFLQPGATGLDMPPPDIATEDYALLDGGAVNRIRYATRSMAFAVAVKGPTREAFMQIRRGLRRALDPQRGRVTISVTEPDGSERHCTAVYTGGFEGDEARDSAGRTWARTGVQLMAPDPFWYGSERRMRFGMVPGTPFLTHLDGGTPTPFLPLRISPSLLLGGQNIDSGSEADTWPIWRFVGPFGAAMRLANLTSGRTMTVNAMVGPGEVLEIDTRPGRKRVELIPVSGVPVNAWPSVESADLWPLTGGVNLIDVSADGADPQSSIEVTFIPRYLGH